MNTQTNKRIWPVFFQFALMNSVSIIIMHSIGTFAAGMAAGIVFGVTGFAAVMCWRSV